LKRGTVTVRTAFPFWMTKGNPLVAPFEIIRRKGDLILHAKFDPPAGSPMRRANLSILRDGDEFPLDYPHPVRR
jgi:hypothetical protein